MQQIADIIGRVTAHSAGPDLVLVAISSMAAAVIALALKVTFGHRSDRARIVALVGRSSSILGVGRRPRARQPQPSRNDLNRFA